MGRLLTGARSRPSKRWSWSAGRRSRARRSPHRAVRLQIHRHLQRVQGIYRWLAAAIQHVLGGAGLSGIRELEARPKSSLTARIADWRSSFDLAETAAGSPGSASALSAPCCARTSRSASPLVRDALDDGTDWRTPLAACCISPGWSDFSTCGGPLSLSWSTCQAVRRSSVAAWSRSCRLQRTEVPVLEVEPPRSPRRLVDGVADSLEVHLGHDVERELVGHDGHLREARPRASLALGHGRADCPCASASGTARDRALHDIGSRRSPADLGTFAVSPRPAARIVRTELRPGPGARHRRDGFFARLDRPADAIPMHARSPTASGRSGRDPRRLHVGEAELMEGKVGGSPSTSVRA